MYMYNQIKTYPIINTAVKVTPLGNTSSVN